MGAMNMLLAVETSLPADREQAALVGRMWLPDASGPVLVVAIGDHLHDLSSIAPTATALMELPDPARAVRAATGLPKLAALSDVLANCAADRQDTGKPYLLAPCDLQAIKASGVTFVSSMLERVIEEHTRGDPAKAESVRQSLVAAIGDD
jgi:fumarylacetoacetate (FAA) hydrolase family protein